MTSEPRRRGRPNALTHPQIGAAVAELGLETFSIKQLALHLGVSENTLYNYAKGRKGLMSLGMEHLLKSDAHPLEITWSDDSDWREVLVSQAEQSWSLMKNVPGAGNLMAAGVHTPSQMEFGIAVGSALMKRGFSADQAIEAMMILYRLVAQAYVDFFRVRPDDTPEVAREREESVRQLVSPGPNASAEVVELHAAMMRSLARDAAEKLRDQVDITIRGIASRFEV